MSTPCDWDALVDAALAARQRSYSPYSRFAVGAAILTGDGAVYGGTNVENRSFGLTICAERVAIGAAVADGARRLLAVAVVTGTDPPAPPCGMCRETMAEFAGADLPILLANADGARRLLRLGELFPQPFALPNER